MNTDQVINMQRKCCKSMPTTCIAIPCNGVWCSQNITCASVYMKTRLMLRTCHIYMPRCHCLCILEELWLCCPRIPHEQHMDVTPYAVLSLHLLWLPSKQCCRHAFFDQWMTIDGRRNGLHNLVNCRHIGMVANVPDIVTLQAAFAMKLHKCYAFCFPFCGPNKWPHMSCTVLFITSCNQCAYCA